MKEYNYYLFDFDGTLCDTTEGIFKSIIYSLDCYGIKETDLEKLRYFVGPPLFESYKTIYNVSDEDANWLIAKYRERYKTKAAEESAIYDGIAIYRHRFNLLIPTCRGVCVPHNHMDRAICAYLQTFEIVSRYGVPLANNTDSSRQRLAIADEVILHHLRVVAVAQG